MKSDWAVKFDNTQVAFCDLPWKSFVKIARANDVPWFDLYFSPIAVMLGVPDIIELAAKQAGVPFSELDEKMDGGTDAIMSFLVRVDGADDLPTEWVDGNPTAGEPETT